MTPMPNRKRRFSCFEPLLRWIARKQCDTTQYSGLPKSATNTVPLVKQNAKLERESMKAQRRDLYLKGRGAELRKESAQRIKAAKRQRKRARKGVYSEMRMAKFLAV